MTTKPLIYLEQFYHLRPDLRENEEFQHFLTTINTGGVGYTEKDIYAKTIPANLVLDSDELAMFYEKYPANHNAIYASLWEYAEAFMPPAVFETVVKRDFLPHTEITGNIFTDLGNEFQYALEQLQQGHTYKSEIFYADIDQPKQAILSISTSYQKFYPLVAYYGNLMDYSPQEMFLQIIRVLNEAGKSETNYSHEISLYNKQKKETDFNPLIQIIDNLKTAGEEKTRDHLNPSTAGILLPNWAGDWPENPGTSLIEDTLFNFYTDLTTIHSRVEEGLSGLQEKWRPQLYKVGLSESLVSALFNYDPQNSSTHFGQVREKVNLLIEAGGYKIIELKNYFKANKNLYILGKEKTAYTYRGVTTPSQKLASYTIIASYPKDSITLTENQTLNVDNNLQITDLPFVLDIIGFDDKFLSPLKKTDAGKKLLTEVFGPGLSMDKKTFDQFTDTLQITSALSITPEAIVGEYDAEKAIIDAISQSTHPAQLFIYLYSLLFGPLQKFQSLRDAILSILEKLNIPSLQTNAASDDELIVQAQGTVITRTSIKKDMFSNEVLTTLSFIFNEEQINQVNRQAYLERYFSFAQKAGVTPPKKLSDDEINFEPYKAEESFLETCEFILSESEFYSHPEFYYEISEAATTKTREHTPKVLVRESQGLPLHWFEKEAQKMELSWEKFVLADTNQNGELSFMELFAMEMDASEKIIYERVMQKHHLQIAPRLKKFLRQNPHNHMISVDGMPRGLTKIAYRNTYLGSHLDDLADDYPFLGLIQLFNPRYNMDITQDPAQALLHKYPLGVRMYLGGSERAVEMRIQKILESNQKDSKKLEKIKVLLLKHLDDPGRSQSLFMVGNALPQMEVTQEEITSFLKSFSQLDQDIMTLAGWGMMSESEENLRAILTDPFLNEKIFHTFFLLFPPEKPEGFDRIMKVMGSLPKEQSMSFLLQFSEHLEISWAAESMANLLQNSTQITFSDLIERKNYTLPETSWEAQMKLLPFAVKYHEKIGISLNKILEIVAATLHFTMQTNIYHDATYQIESIKPVIDQILTTIPTDELLLALNQNMRIPAYNFALVLLATSKLETYDAPTRTKFGILLEKIAPDIGDESFPGKVARLCGLIGENKINTYLDSLSLNPESQRIIRSKLSSVFVNFENLDSLFRQFNAFFREGFTPTYALMLDRDYENYFKSGMSKIKYHFFHSLSDAIAIVTNPQSPEEEQAKKDELLAFIDSCIQNTTSSYIKTSLLALRWQMDPATDLQFALETRDQFYQNNSALNVFDRKIIIENGWPDGKEFIWLESATGLPTRFYEKASSSPEVYYIEQEKPDGLNHASLMEAVYETNNVESTFVQLRAGFNFEDAIYSTLSSLDFSEIKTVSISLATYNTRFISPKHVKQNTNPHLQELLENLNQQGVVVVVSAGNEGGKMSVSALNQLNILSAYSPPVCIVGATKEIRDTLPHATADYSSRGSYYFKPTLSADGSFFAGTAGTSMAAPNIASTVVAMNRIPNQLTAVQKIVLMMLSASSMKNEPRYAQGAGFVHEERSVWLTYYFSEPHTKDELKQKAIQLGLASDLDWLYYLVEKYEKKVHENPTQLWRELLYK